MHLSLPPNRSARARDERGFTMLLALYVLIITTLLLGAAFVAVLSDAAPARNDLDQKRAYAAAQAGIAQYNYDLNQNPNFWESCTSPVGTVGATDSGSTETFILKPVPATGYSSCTVNSIPSMIEATGTPAAGSFRIASTGTSNKVSRTIVAQYTRNSFLSYVYFTNYEDSDPEWAPDSGLSCAVYAWAGRNSSCAATAFGAGDAVNGPLHSNDTVGVCDGYTGSGTTTFGRAGQSPADSIETPNVLAQGSGCSGTIMMNGTPNNTVGTLQPPPDDTQLLSVADGGVPANSNGCYSGAGCVFTGPTTIVLDGPTSGVNKMTVTNAAYGSPAGTATTVVFPSDGVVYVSANNSCSYAYSPFGSTGQLYGSTTLDAGDTTDNAGCGDAVVSASTSASSCSGTTQVSGVCPYTQSLTIGAADDIIIASSLTTTTTTSGCSGETGGCPTGTAVLGLIADHNVRVAHPITSARVTPPLEQYCLASSPSDSHYLNTNAAGSLINPVIDAAIFAVNDSFIVDNFDCGSTSNSTPGAAPSQLGTLTVNGTIAQNFRGRVAEGNPQVSGYTKSYWYDPRLESTSPPYFLNPIDATWVATRLTECDIAASC
jgi:Tfp pilus assembly protein PilX